MDEGRSAISIKVVCFPLGRVEGTHRMSASFQHRAEVLVYPAIVAILVCAPTAARTAPALLFLLLPVIELGYELQRVSDGD